MRRTVLLTACLTGLPIGLAAAQCPDGTPHPCAVARPTARPAPPPPNVRARHLMLLPFRNVTRAPSHDWLTTGAPLLLAETFAQFNDLRVVPEPRLTAARRRLGLPPDIAPDEAQLRRLADETGGWTSISGSIIATGTNVRIAAEAFDPVSSKVIGRAVVDVAVGDDVRGAFDQITVQLLRTVGITGGNTDVVALTTKSIDAYRSYVDGVGFMQRGAYRRAETAFADAVRRDSTFAIAWVRLGTAAIQSRGLTELMNPLGLSGQAVERAARAFSSLPPRTAATIRAIQNLFHGEVARSHLSSDSLIATDPDDVDALVWSAMINFFDSRLDPVTGLRIGSLNTAIARAKTALERDPGRQEMYLVPAMIYGFGAGFLGGAVGGRRRPVASLAAEIMVPPDVVFAVTVEDSIVLVTEATHYRRPRSERDSLQRRAAGAGVAWIQRWKAANPNDPEAYVWASRFEELRGDYAKSLEELERAIALGLESNIENLRSRRMSLYEMTGRYSAAEAIADSIIASGTLRTRPFNSWIDRGRVFVPAVLIRSKQWSKAATVGAMLADPGSRVDACDALNREMTSSSVQLPTVKLRALADTAANNYLALLKSSASLCADYWAGGLALDSAEGNRPAVASRMLQIADSMRAAGRPTESYRAARVAAFADRSRLAIVQTTPWIDSLAARMEAGARFEPGEAIVAGDSLVVTYRLTGAEPIIIDPAGISLARFFTFSAIGPTPDTVVFAIRLSHSGPAMDSIRYGSLGEFAATMDQHQSEIVYRDGRAPLLAGVDVATRANSLRATVRGEIVRELIRLRPVHGRLHAVCPLSTRGICQPKTVTIEYR